jgi:hypothetical protein
LSPEFSRARARHYRTVVFTLPFVRPIFPDSVGQDSDRISARSSNRLIDIDFGFAVEIYRYALEGPWEDPPSLTARKE